MYPIIRGASLLAVAGGTILLVAARTTDRSVELRPAIDSGTAKHIILFIGDGMGDSEITIARNYAVGAAGRLAMDALPFTGEYTTYSIAEDDPSKPVYVADSAATGTAWATGSKTSNGRISTSAKTDRDLPTILELAQQRGYATGDVTTAELTDATPAVLAAHVASRSCQGPDDMAQCPQDRKTVGGPGSIAEQMIDRGVDVLLGGGSSRFEQSVSGEQTVAHQASTNGYQLVKTAQALRGVSSSRVLGLFAAGTMTTEWIGQEALPYPSNVKNPQVCETDHRRSQEPSLSEMTAKAIDLLERATRDGAFFLQVEGASIDKQSHAANPCAQIGETIAFDRAVRVGLEYAAAHRDTLLVVAADHGHSGQIVSTPADADHPSGLLSTLLTADRTPMTVSYATAAYHRSQDHTGTQVRIAAQGPQAAAVLGVIDQTDLFRVMARALGASTPPPSSAR
jgi:alkaline phosphatase